MCVCVCVCVWQEETKQKPTKDEKMRHIKILNEFRIKIDIKKETQTYSLVMIKAEAEKNSSFSQNDGWKFIQRKPVEGNIK